MVNRTVIGLTATMLNNLDGEAAMALTNVPAAKKGNVPMKQLYVTVMPEIMCGEKMQDYYSIRIHFQSPKLNLATSMALQN